MGGLLNEEATNSHAYSSTVLILSSDLFFAMRIRDALKQLGYQSQTIRSEIEFQSALNGSGQPVLGVIDFNHGIDWDALAPTLIESDMPTIAFGPHKDTEGFAVARQAGVTRVISNGAFTSTLPDIVQKYARPAP